MNDSIPVNWIRALVEARRLLIRGLRNLNREDYVRLGTAGSCRAGALLLHAALLKHDAESRPVIKVGIYAVNRFQQSEHFWVEAEDAHKSVWILDVTSDQFAGRILHCNRVSPNFPYPYLYGETISEVNEWRLDDQRLLDELNLQPQNRLDHIYELYFTDQATGLKRPFTVRYT